MNMFSLFIIVAALAAVYALASGVSSMAFGGEVNHRSSVQWMTLRVVFQAAAVVLILLSLLHPG
jgi:Hypoxia induced protein conserved region